MHQIKDRSSGVHLSQTLNVYPGDDGMTEVSVKTVGEGIEACAAAVINPDEVCGLINYLIRTYNHYVSSGLVDTPKYPINF